VTRLDRRRPDALLSPGARDALLSPGLGAAAQLDADIKRVLVDALRKAEWKRLPLVRCARRC
jgi:hypothetical protein